MCSLLQNELLESFSNTNPLKRMTQYTTQWPTYTYANILLQNIWNWCLFELRSETITNLMKLVGLICYKRFSQCGIFAQSEYIYIYVTFVQLSCTLHGQATNWIKFLWWPSFSISIVTHSHTPMVLYLCRVKKNPSEQFA